MNNNGVMTFFDMFEDNKEIQEFNKTQEVEKKVVEKPNKSKETTKVQKPVEKVDPNKKIEEDCSKCKKIIVKVFGQTIFSIENEEEIKSIKLENIQNRLIEGSFDEFATIKPVWHLSTSENKAIGYLIPTYDNFYNKG